MKQITAAAIGFGDRAEIYCRYALKNPDELKIVAVVDPDPLKRKYAKELFGIAEENCFRSVEEFVGRGRIADCVINGTMDELHIATTLPLLPLGYDVLLEKPVTNNEKELKQLEAEAERYKNKIVVCHVLRYTPFYRKIKEIVAQGEIGEIKHIETAENVGFAHASVSYIRGKWNNRKKCGSSYLLAKCCHDTDLICWLNDKSFPQEISSFGTKAYWIADKAPKGSGTRCLIDCAIEKECPFSAKKMYLDNNPMPITLWADIPKNFRDVTYEERETALKTTSPFGVCIYKTDADVVDQQTTMIKFADGSTACHTLVSGVARAGRRIKIYGTLGEIEGFTEDNFFFVRTYNASNILYDERKIEITEDILGDNHYGGDRRIVEDFLRVIRGEKPSVSTSTLKASVVSHLCVYAADKSMEERRIVEL